MDVLAVADQLGIHIVIFAGGTDGAGLPVVDTGHSVV